MMIAIEKKIGRPTNSVDSSTVSPDRSPVLRIDAFAFP